MEKYLTRGAVLFLLTAVSAQAMLSSPHSAYAQDEPAYTPGQFQQLVAPIALYPDPLLGEILMASTYPYEVAAAAQWRDANPGISGDYLTAALAQQPWDPSVKGLTEFPDVLQMMNNNLDWTEKLGEAFLDDQPGVMDSVQQLRQQAQMSGALASGQQETVSDQDGYISIEPADPAQVYVPYYNPATVFSPWAYPAYAPYTFTAPNGVIYANNGYFGYYPTGIFVVDALWGWDTWNWHDHYIHIDDRHWRTLDNGLSPPHSHKWQFAPQHRDNVPYKNAAVRAHFENTPPMTLSPYRGYEEKKITHEAAAPKVAPPAEARPIETGQPETRHVATRQPEARQPEARQPEIIGQPEAVQPEIRQVETRQAEPRQPDVRQHEARQPAAEAPRAAPPMLESFAPRLQTSLESMRGNASAHAAPAAPAPRAPEARAPSPPRNDPPSGSQKDERK